ncbi:hypothetical protein [Modestobacter marinus]|uniref:hypothetical protein n=1 Tax=Modestobacter marinus TaxID=477641 RepID=UPI001C95C27F|nr:hypothetical protein [Modestobacter marinus]
MRLGRSSFVTAADLAAVEAAGRRHELDVLTVTSALARPTAALSHATAARLWRLPVPAGLPPDVRLTHPECWRSGPGCVMTRADLPAAEVTTRGRHRLTTPARALVDTAREWPERPARGRPVRREAPGGRAAGDRGALPPSGRRGSGPGWASVEARIHRDLAAPGPALPPGGAS